jgi:hypothetical protein
MPQSKKLQKVHGNSRLHLSGIKDVYAVFFHYLSAPTRIPLKLHITFLKKDL